jgi:aryl-alcohol dehydrogenase-like predicted oxidoreductase
VLDLDDLSAIGFGTYRWTATDEQVRALHLALDSGCNLVDTAATYGDGLAERGLGRELTERAVPTFVITKAGYLHEGEAAADAVVLADGRSCYSVHPDLLARRVAQSSHRLGRAVLDGFLLHNPEHLLAGKGIDGYLRCVSRAFEFCEQQVSDGRIRFYGISSNTLSRSDHPLGLSIIDKLLTIAESTASGHHFRLLQFPHNLVERQAAERGPGGPCLLELAARAGLRTFGNRPLSVKTEAGPHRLLDAPPPPVRPSAAVLAELSAGIDHALATAGIRAASEPPVLTAITDQWPEVRTVDAVEFVVEHLLAPVVARLSGTPRAPHLAVLLSELRAAALAEARGAQAAAVAAVIDQARLAGDPYDPVPLRACQSYLQDGLDHILVGMRRAEHVHTLAPLLARSPST